MHGKHQRGAEVRPRRRLVFITQHDDGVIDRRARARVEMAQRGLLRGQQLHRAGLNGGAGDKKIALPVDRAKACLLDFEQTIGDLGHRLRVAKIGPQHRHLAR